MVPDGRFLFGRINNSNLLVDALAEKTFRSPVETWKYHPMFGWSGWSLPGTGCEVYRLPRLDQLTIPPMMLELWAQVAVRGELGPDNEFVKWDEATWDKKRQQLAALPPPIADFPFPGYVAADRFHWLRSEFNGANDKDKPRLAQQLLDRAEAAGDAAEAARWRTEKEQLPKPPAKAP